MSHIFISYAHSDKAHLDRLVAWLRDSGFADHQLWYDQHIEDGNNWRDEIASALDESFVVLLILTSNSVKSLYCTYEWAYAMGQGITTLPLVFDQVSIADVPSPLTSKQFTTCTESIPDYLKEQLNRLKSTPPQVAAINKLVFETIYDTHRRFFILGWLGNEIKYFEPQQREYVITYFAENASEAHQKLVALMVDKAFAFSGRQYRLCWKLIDFLHEFSRLQYKSETHLQEHLFPQFDSTWLPAFEYFEGKEWWQHWVQRYFEWDLEAESNRMQVFAEILRVFPIIHVSEVDMLIHNKNADLKAKKT